MKKLPRVAGLILCKRMEVNPTTVEMSLVGLFDTLEFSQWPAYAAPFTAYATLFDALAEGKMELTVTHLESEEVVYTQQKWFASSDRRLVFHTEMRVRRCIFPAPGRHAVTLQLDGQELTRRYLDVWAKENVP